MSKLFLQLALAASLLSGSLSLPIAGDNGDLTWSDGSFDRRAPGDKDDLVWSGGSFDRRNTKDLAFSRGPYNRRGKDDGEEGQNSGKEPESTGGSGGGGDDLSMLFPVETDSGSKWTTAGPNGLPLQDKSTLRWEHQWSDPKFEANPSDKKMAVHAFYPKGSYVPSKEIKGGFGFYSEGPESVKISEAKELTFGYSVFFEDGFDFVKGGKMPGVYGGADADGAKGCSGGRGRADCFSSRLMWREEGKGELYPYIPTKEMSSDFSANEGLCSGSGNDVKIHCNMPYGMSIGTGAFKFTTGKWNHVVQRIRLNDPGKANGEIEVFYEGKSAFILKDFMFRNKAEEKMWGLQMETFFGGNGKEWASPKDQNAYFADFSVAITQKL